MSSMLPLNVEEDFMPMKLGFKLRASYSSSNRDGQSIVDNGGFRILPYFSPTSAKQTVASCPLTNLVSKRAATTEKRNYSLRLPDLARKSRTATQKKMNSLRLPDLARKSRTATQNKMNRSSMLNSNLQEPEDFLGNRSLSISQKQRKIICRSKTTPIQEGSEWREPSKGDYSFDENAHLADFTHGRLSFLPLPDNQYGSILTASFFGDDYYYDGGSPTPLSRINGLEMVDGSFKRQHSARFPETPVSFDDYVGKQRQFFYTDLDSPREMDSRANTEKSGGPGRMFNFESHTEPERIESRNRLQTDTTSVILRNIPQLTQDKSLKALLRELELAGFVGGEAFDFVFVPINFAISKSMGCAFINFLSPQLAYKFSNMWHKTYFPSNFGTGAAENDRPTKRYRKMCVVESQHQGQEANIAFVLNNHKTLHNSKTRYHPVIYANGEKVPYTRYVDIK